MLLCLVCAMGGSQLATATAPENDEPEITISRSQSEIIEEYRANGQLYMIKITPRKGFVYYLVDSDGDGTLDRRHNGLNEGLLVPQWTLFNW